MNRGLQRDRMTLDETMNKDNNAVSYARIAADRDMAASDQAFRLREMEIQNLYDTKRITEQRAYNLKKQLEARIDTISGGLSSMGLMAAKLDTQGLIELFYNAYNQETAANQPLDNVEKININNNF